MKLKIIKEAIGVLLMAFMCLTVLTSGTFTEFEVNQSKSMLFILIFFSALSIQRLIKAIISYYKAKTS
ncbi:hypothetical protein [Marivirga atlantica]|jgi:hypothetical protein|uniref:Uncharacterized protein n=1 Tax=Marivirga atlantica TaxID=1548457 RepID=A0A937ABQ3_9BACT|nr:hypothetical protein [Marivirga atlantica]MBL0763664.1 hypothetical protein [Marivirga atlantica]